MTSPLPTLSQYSHTCVFPSDVCTWICATRLASAFNGHAHICPSNAPWCTHDHLNEFFCSVIRNVATTAAKSSCLLALMGIGERKPQVWLSLKNVTSFTILFLSYRLSSPSLWCSIFPNTQKIIKWNNFQVSHRLLLWWASFTIYLFAHPVR